jgi:hypothetical protein
MEMSQLPLYNYHTLIKMLKKNIYRKLFQHDHQHEPNFYKLKLTQELIVWW